MFVATCALRIYLKRSDNSSETGLLRRFFRRPLAHYLLQQALKAGVTHASVSLGHMGYTRGAKVVASDVTEIPMTTLPVCLELVAPKPLLEQFVRDHAKSLVDATLMMVDGVQLATTPVSASAPHHVEYVKAGELVLAVDHVDGPADRKSEAAVD